MFFYLWKMNIEIEKEKIREKKLIKKQGEWRWQRRFRWFTISGWLAYVHGWRHIGAFCVNAGWWWCVTRIFSDCSRLTRWPSAIAAWRGDRWCCCTAARFALLDVLVECGGFMWLRWRRPRSIGAVAMQHWCCCVHIRERRWGEYNYWFLIVQYE